jgi:hypothetical protein
MRVDFNREHLVRHVRIKQFEFDPGDVSKFLKSCAVGKCGLSFFVQVTQSFCPVFAMTSAPAMVAVIVAYVACEFIEHEGLKYSMMRRFMQYQVLWHSKIRVQINRDETSVETIVPIVPSNFPRLGEPKLARQMQF